MSKDDIETRLLAELSTCPNEIDRLKIKLRNIDSLNTNVMRSLVDELIKELQSTILIEQMIANINERTLKTNEIIAIKKMKYGSPTTATSYNLKLSQKLWNIDLKKIEEGYNMDRSYICEIELPPESILMTCCVDKSREELDILRKYHFYLLCDICDIISACMIDQLEVKKKIIFEGKIIRNEEIVFIERDDKYPLIILTTLLHNFDKLNDGKILRSFTSEYTDFNKECTDTELYNCIRNLKILIFIFCNYTKIDKYFNEFKVWEELKMHCGGDICVEDQINKLREQNHIRLIQEGKSIKITK